MFIDHLTDTTLSLGGTFYFPTLRHFGLCSAAEFFVFFSGYVFGVVYIKRLATLGFWHCQLKALARVQRILITNLLMLAIVAGLAFLFPNKPQSYIAYSDLWFLYSDFGTALINFALLQYFPVYTDILPLYIVLLIFSPCMLLLLKEHVLAGLVLSLALYIAAATIPWLNLPLISASKDHWGFNPLSWQLLFFMGIALGSRGACPQVNVLGRRTTLWIIGFALGAIAICKTLGKVGKVYHIPYLGTLGDIANLPGMDVQTLGVIRI
jgi:hypothetical protein